jgi:hypothetical protein
MNPLKIIGMGSSAGKNDPFLAKVVNQNSIVFNVAFGKTAIITGKTMFPTTLRQWFSYNFYYNIKNII